MRPCASFGLGRSSPFGYWGMGNTCADCPVGNTWLIIRRRGARVAAPPVTAAVGELAADGAGFITGCERLRTDASTGSPRLLLAVPFRTQNGGQTKLRFCDYASAGRTWAEDSAFRVWLPPSADLSRLLTEIALAADRHWLPEWVREVGAESTSIPIPTSARPPEQAVLLRGA